MSKKTCVSLYESVNSLAVGALSEGFSRNGYDIIRRDANGFKPRDAERDVDLVVVHGLRGKFGDAANFYKDLGTPVLVFDFGYLDRVNNNEDYFNKHWCLGFDFFGWTPDFACKSDRFDKLNIKIDFSERKPEKKIYVMGQMPNDASHGMNEHQLKTYYNKLLVDCKTRAPKDYQVIFRAHPRAKKMVPDHWPLIDNGTLDECLRSAHCIITYNSTVGIDAMRIGCPFLCDDSAYYKKYGNSLTADFNKLKTPNEKEVNQYYNKLAYSQWTLDECRAGLPVKFLLENSLIKEPFQ